MSLVVPFTELVQQVACSMTAPSLATFLILVTGWVFAPRRTVTGMILAARAVGLKHHSAWISRQSGRLENLTPRQPNWLIHCIIWINRSKFTDTAPFPPPRVLLARHSIEHREVRRTRWHADGPAST
jgi:hypothetical protein